ncbi:SCO4848 family membrane protein [Microbacterium sp. R86528]|uniref:SCO4848 family membrane protein n=1 Tax=Microbacterium sp. R86528 TaxID=3093864 RepID=UPI0037C5BD75
METIAAIALFANAVFNAVVWPRFYPRIANDARAGEPGARTAFYRVHVVLITIALVLAAASLVIGVLLLV